jgi:micrococcal nuclease
MDLYLYQAQVLRVIDGDTLVAELDLGFHTFRREPLRLLGVDAPELNSADPAEKELAQKAKVELALLTLSCDKGLLVRTRKDKQDKFGRYLADVFVPKADGTQLHVNTYMLENGFAKFRAKDCVTPNP